MKNRDQAKQEALNEVFQAMSDPTRRQVLERLAKGPASVSELAEPFELAMPSFMQHLKMLEEAGLMSSSKNGRVRTCQIKPEMFNVAFGWLEQQRLIWDQRLNQLDEYLLKMKKERT